MSLFDKNLIEKPLTIPFEDYIKKHLFYLDFSNFFSNKETFNEFNEFSKHIRVQINKK